MVEQVSISIQTFQNIQQQNTIGLSSVAFIYTGSDKQLKVNECTFGYLLKQTIKITDVHFLTNKLSKIINYLNIKVKR